MVYIHTPFCRSFCTYCDFYSELCPRDVSQEVQSALFSSFQANVLEEIGRRVVSPGAPDTIYFGGGTPSVLPLDVVQAIVAALRERGVLGADGFTFEVNPDDIVTRGSDYVASLLSLGVSRISMGVQSFDDGILRWMNRRHSAADAAEAMAILRRAGVQNISIDLIFGLSQLSEPQWLETIEKALQLHPEHISAYQLSIEEGSALGRMARSGQYEEASDELCRRQYDLLCEKLRAAGYHHYEISNWALPGREAVHNSAYWRRIPYIGLGPGAHSLTFRPHPASAFAPPSGSLPHASSTSVHHQPLEMLVQPSGSVSLCAAAPSCEPQPLETSSHPSGSFQQVRSWNSEGIQSYTSESEVLTADEIRTETIMLALRTSAGIPAALLHSLVSSTDIESESANPSSVRPSSVCVSLTETSSVEPTFVDASSVEASSDASPVVEALLSEGALVRVGDRIRIPEDHFFVSDDIISRLI